MANLLITATTNTLANSNPYTINNNLIVLNSILFSDNKTNIPILINTSLNLPGEVLVETLHDLREMFVNSKLKYIYLPEINKMISK